MAATDFAFSNPYQNIEPIKDAVKHSLTGDLLKPGFGPGAHCYVASEALYHMLGGKAAGYTPMNQVVEGTQHWWLRGPDGRDHDITADQFGHPVDYTTGRGRGFMTAQPSKRAKIVIDRAQQLLNPRTSNVGNLWVYLNGHIGLGTHHNNIISELGPKAGIDNLESTRLGNLVASGIYPATDHDFALGSLHNGRPHIWISNVDRNSVADSVRDHLTPAAGSAIM